MRKRLRKKLNKKWNWFSQPVGGYTVTGWVRADTSSRKFNRKRPVTFKVNRWLSPREYVEFDTLEMIDPGSEMEDFDMETGDVSEWVTR